MNAAGTAAGFRISGFGFSFCTPASHILASRNTNIDAHPCHQHPKTFTMRFEQRVLPVVNPTCNSCTLGLHQDLCNGLNIGPESVYIVDVQSEPTPYNHKACSQTGPETLGLKKKNPGRQGRGMLSRATNSAFQKLETSQKPKTRLGVRAQHQKIHSLSRMPCFGSEIFCRLWCVGMFRLGTTAGRLLP